MSVNIRINNAVKKFGENTVISDLSVDIKDKELFTLLGPSGCGKTTLLRMIAGFNSIEGGEFYFNEKKINEEEVETILLRLHSATGAAEIGDVGVAAGEVEHLVDDLIGGNTATLNPFLFRHFWLGLDTRWPAGGDEGVLIVRIINDGPVAMPGMRLAPPVPDGWTCVPSSVDLPIIAPGGNLPLRFEVKANRRYGADEIPLSRKLAIATSYEMRTGDITATIRAQNRSMEPLQDIVLSPWIPPGFTTDSVPFINRLAPDEVALIRMPLRINIGSGGNA